MHVNYERQASFANGCDCHHSCGQPTHFFDLIERALDFVIRRMIHATSLCRFVYAATGDGSIAIIVYGIRACGVYNV
jgi:hypothetical protein